MPKLSPTKLIVVPMLLTPLPAFAQGGEAAAAPEADRPAVLQRAVLPADPQSEAAVL